MCGPVKSDPGPDQGPGPGPAVMEFEVAGVKCKCIFDIENWKIFQGGIKDGVEDKDR
jgi:hypothetical protein